MKNQIEKAKKTGHANAETKLLTKDGDKIPFFFTGVSIVYEGKNCILGNGVDISERKRSEEEILEINKQLRNLSAHLQNIREEERKRIGREIHDDLGQQLTAIKMDVAWIDKKISEKEIPIKGKLKNIIGLLDGSNQSVRRILNELKPSILDEYGLLDAMEWHAKQFTESTGIRVVFNTPEDAIKLEEAIATCIFRVFQESLTNVARHSAAKKVIISVALMSDRIDVSIADDGKGFEFAAVQHKGSFGLLGMRERVRAVNGIMELNSVVKEGTTVTISIPFQL
jgi:signal transduction histidine kinase